MPDTDVVLPRDVRIAGTVAFVEHVGTMAAAEFIIDLQDAVNGLSRNNAALAAALKGSAADQRMTDPGAST